jgi:hypothetical protein
MSLNDGAFQIKFDNPGSTIALTNGTSAPLEVFNIVAGSLSYDVPGIEHGAQMDRNRITGVLAGSERPCNISFTLKVTGNLFDTSEWRALTSGALATSKIAQLNSTGQIFTFGIQVFHKHGTTATSGTRLTFANCVLESALNFQASAGVDSDEITASVISYDSSPTFTAVA